MANFSSEDRERLQFVCTATSEKIAALGRTINFQMLIAVLVVGIVASLSLSVDAAIQINDHRSVFQAKISEHNAVAGLEMRVLQAYRVSR